MSTLTIPFVLRGAPGEISVSIEPAASVEAGASGTWRGEFPTCTATIEHPARGYDAMCGWVQFVRSTDSARPTVFEMDPLPFTDDIDLPYCWFGTKPTLYDAPSRDSGENLTWRAQSFLCASPEGMDRRVEQLTGFSWGFDVVGGVMAFVPPSPLSAEDSAQHFAVLRDTYPRWTFLDGRR